MLFLNEPRSWGNLISGTKLPGCFPGVYLGKVVGQLDFGNETPRLGAKKLWGSFRKSIVGFLNNELELAGDLRRLEDFCTVTDTLKLARELHPGQRNSLDALCRRYGVDNTGRTLHGALLDAEILADVYLAMTGGQTDLQLEGVSGQSGMDRRLGGSDSNAGRNFAIIPASDEELAAHRKWVELLGAGSVWNSVDSPGDNESG